jgi:hypothetical protein
MKTFSVPNLEHADNPRMTGATLATKVRKMSTAQRAALAVRLQFCDVSITGLLPTQTAALTNVGIGSVRLAANASEADLVALKRGQLSLRQLRDKHRKPPTEAEIRAFIKAAGLDRTFSILDEMTKPALDLMASLQVATAMAAE